MKKEMSPFWFLFVLIYLLSEGIAFAIGITYDIDKIYLEIW